MSEKKHAVFRMRPETRALYATDFCGEMVEVVHAPNRNLDHNASYTGVLISVGSTVGVPNNFVITLRRAGHHMVDMVVPLAQVLSITRTTSRERTPQ